MQNIQRIPNYDHEGRVLAERHRRDAIDPLWRERLVRPFRVANCGRVG